MDSPIAASKSDVKRLERRRKILQNAESRMNKLKNVQRRNSPPPAVESEIEVTSLPPDNHEEDNMDRTILSQSHSYNSFASTSTQSLTSTQSRLELEGSEHVQHELLLSRAVRSFGAKWAWRVRTCLALFCVAVSLLLDVFAELRYSCVVLMVILDFSWLAYLLLVQPSYCNEGITSNSLVTLLSLPLFFLSPTTMNAFDFVCQLLWLVSFLLRDVFVMLFVMILSKSVQLYALH